MSPEPTYTVAMSQLASQQNVVELLDQLGGMLTSSLNLKENIDFMLQATSRMVQFDAASVFCLMKTGRSWLPLRPTRSPTR